MNISHIARNMLHAMHNAYPVVNLVIDEAGPHAATHLVKATVDWDQKNQSTGWGRDEDFEQSKHKALGEAVERYAYQQAIPMKFSRFADLINPISPESIIRYSSEQYASAKFPFKPFNSDARYWWVEGQSVLSNARVNILADCILSSHVFDEEYRSRLYTNATSSGCASGRSLDDAILRGALELVERDAFMRHWFKQSSGSGVIADTLPESIRLRTAALHQYGLEVGIRCLHDGPYPAWFVWAQHEQSHFTAIGSSCGLDAEEALKGALDELETSVLQNLLGAYGQVNIQAAAVWTPEDHGALYATQEYFRKADDFLRSVDARVTWFAVKERFASNSAAFFRSLEAKNLGVYWIDLSLEQASRIVDGFPMYTVRVVVPGLIPLTFGHDRLPLGMIEWPIAGGNLVHPFT